MENASSVSKSALWIGRSLSGLVVAFLTMDAVMKLLQPAPVVEASAKLGMDRGTITGLGVLLLACTLLYAFRRTAVLGAVLLTGYLGGAVATHVVTHGPVFSLVFPVFLGAIAWGGLAIRDSRARALLPAIGSRREPIRQGATL